ncbi:MAG: helix-turn-helix domain-containing protein [Ruminiclostridium sp.]
MAYFKRIRDLREDSDLTQKALAEYLGTTTQYYGRYEQGQIEIPFERAIKLAEFYNVSLDFLAGRTDNKDGFAAENLQKSLKACEEKLSRYSDELNKNITLVSKFEKLSDTSKLIVLNLLEELAKGSSNN